MGKTMKGMLCSLFVMTLTFPAMAQQASPTPAASTGMSATLNKNLGVYVFPAKNQDAATQEKECNECYAWAKQQTGVDALNPPEVAAAQTPTGPDGTAVRGAAKGAAAGAAIGAIAGDAGKGAAIGATAGGAKGAAGRKKGQAQQAQQAEQAAGQQEAAQMDSFKKAYSACLTGKGYTVN
jgi:hypothetical protein